MSLQIGRLGLGGYYHFLRGLVSVQLGYYENLAAAGYLPQFANEFHCLMLHVFLPHVPVYLPQPELCALFHALVFQQIKLHILLDVG